MENFRNCKDAGGRKAAENEKTKHNRIQSGIIMLSAFTTIYLNRLVPISSIITLY